MKLVAAVASHLSTSASVTTTAESARIELESSSPWLVVLVVALVEKTSLVNVPVPRL